MSVLWSRLYVRCGWRHAAGSGQYDVRTARCRWCICANIFGFVLSGVHNDRDGDLAGLSGAGWLSRYKSPFRE